MRDIKALRETFQFSPEQLAAVLGISCRTLARWESGRGEPSRLAEREIRRFLDEIKAMEKKNAD